MKDKIYRKISWWLPERLVYWSFVRFWSLATSFEEGANMTPDEMTWSKAIDLWVRKHQKQNYLSKAYCECGHEILQDPQSKVYEEGTFTNIICSNCNRQTTWDLNTPAPLFIKSMK